jgi:hypothetical protein
LRLEGAAGTAGILAGIFSSSLGPPASLPASSSSSSSRLFHAPILEERGQLPFAWVRYGDDHRVRANLENAGWKPALPAAMIHNAGSTEIVET